MLSGIFIIFPFIIAAITGMNIGIILFEPVPEEFEKEVSSEEKVEVNPIIPYIGALLVPVLELSVFCVSLAMGMTLGLALVSNYTPAYMAVLALPRIKAYLVLGVPILFISAALEAWTIKGGLRIRMKK